LLSGRTGLQTSSPGTEEQREEELPGMRERVVKKVAVAVWREWPYHITGSMELWRLRRGVHANSAASNRKAACQTRTPDFLGAGWIACFRENCTQDSDRLTGVTKVVCATHAD